MSIFDNFNYIGLGSSACLIVSVLSSLLVAFDLLNKEGFSKKEENSIILSEQILSIKNLSLIHLLSQIANIISQNKIGSGFDISTAVYGSQIFVKFPEKLINDKVLKLFQEMEDFSMLKSELLNIEKLFSEYEEKIKMLKIDNLKILMFDFTLGSDTRILVPKVKEYLNKNNDFVQTFYTESNLMTETLLSYLSESSKHNQDRKEIFQNFNLNYRKKLKRLGVLSDAPVEPDILTIIMNFFIFIERDVEYIICPGAGGYDAVCSLMSSINLDEYEEKFKSLKEGKFDNLIKEIYNENKNDFIESYEEIVDKIKKIKVNFFERSLENLGLHFTEF